MAFAVLEVAFVESSDDDDRIGFAGFLHRLLQQSLGRARLVEALAHVDTVVALHGIAHISPGVVYGGLAEALPDAVERQYLTLCLER